MDITDGSDPARDERRIRVMMIGVEPLFRGKRSIIMTTKELLQLVEKIFTEKLSRKTGWGKNEILVAYKDSVKEALMEMID
jgi:hypothetical protein